MIRKDTETQLIHDTEKDAERYREALKDTENTRFHTATHIHTHCQGYFDDKGNLQIEIEGENGFAPTICTYFSRDVALSAIDEGGNPIPYLTRAETGEVYLFCPPLIEKKKKITLSRVK